MSLSDVAQDLRHAFRMFAKSPGFALAAVAALALGIGANTAIFSVVNAVILRPLPFVDPDRVVVFQTRTPDGVFAAGSPAKFQHWREQTDVVGDVSAYRSNVMNDTGNRLPEQLRVSQVSADYFRLFGVRPVRGRVLAPEDDRPGGDRTAVISEAFWERRFSRASGVVGTALSLSGEPYTIVGVAAAPPGLEEIDPKPDVWIPFQLDPNSNDQGHYFQVAGRLAPDVAVEQARVSLDASATSFRQKFPNALQDNATFSVEPIGEAMVSNIRPTLVVLTGAVALVLLVACANVANLLLVRAAGRRREIAVRAAIGASRWRIIRQLLTESVVLAGAGGVAGLALGFVGIRALLAIDTAGLPRVGEGGAVVTVDWRVLLFTMGVALATSVIFGVVPALQASRADIGVALKEGGGRSGTGRRQNRVRAVLVVAEVALALVLVIGSALLIRTAVALRQVDPGFDASRVLTMRMSMGDPRLSTSADVEAMIRTGVERLRAVPGVVEASAACCVPLEGGYGLPFVIAGRPLEQGPFHGGGAWLTVSPGYFEVFDIPLRRGRTFTERDTRTAPPVVVINETMARSFWPDGNPLDHRLIIGRGTMREFADEPERQIVGIIADVRDGGLSSEPGPHMYIPQAQVPDAANALNMRISPMAWVVRTAVAPMTVAKPVETALGEATGLPVSSVRAMSEVIDRATSQQRFNMWLMTVFGGAALALAAIGIYGLISYSVEQRTQEIGIRLALGADAGRVRLMVVLQGLRLAAAGVAIGLLSALGLARLISTLLFGVTPWDPLVFVVVPALLSVVALGAVWVPALRAGRVSPIEALRYE